MAIRDEAWALLCEWTRAEALRKHGRAVEGAVAWYGQNRFGVKGAELDTWRAAGLPIGSTGQVPAESWEAAGRRVLDVRRLREWEEGHLPGATHIPLAELPKRADELDRSKEWAIICASGYRSSVASSVVRLISAITSWKRSKAP